MAANRIIVPKQADLGIGQITDNWTSMSYGELLASLSKDLQLDASTDLLPGSLPIDGGPGIQFVDNRHPASSDQNSGRTWARPRATIDSAIAALPNGGHIYVAPGAYSPSGVALNGHMIEGMVFGGGADATRSVVIQHNFNGDLFPFVPGSQGGGLRNLYLNNNGSLTGAAIRASSTAGTPSGYMRFENLVITGGSGFSNDMVLDGGLNTSGIRDIFCNNILFFGGQSASNTVVCNGLIHGYFASCDVVQAPSVLTQGVNLSNAAGGASCEDVFWIGKVLGNWFTQANGNGGSGGCVFLGRITGQITCDTGSQNNVFYGLQQGGFVNSGAVTNRVA